MEGFGSFPFTTTSVLFRSRSCAKAIVRNKRKKKLKYFFISNK